MKVRKFEFTLELFLFQDFEESYDYSQLNVLFFKIKKIDLVFFVVSFEKIHHLIESKHLKFTKS